ncbi:hypothetical protein HK096_002007, partial [Nowakowskiella sp. JEL0078]
LSLAQTQNVRLCPVLVGSVSNDGAFTPLQNVPSASDSSKKVSIFSRESFVDKIHQYSGKSLRDTMERLFQNNVLHLNPNNLHEVAYTLVDLVDGLPEASEDMLYGVPQPPKCFFGRDEYISQVFNGLVETGAVVLTGPGGMGKSSIAASYARTNVSTYTRIFWVPCNTRLSAIAAYRNYMEDIFKHPDSQKLDENELIKFFSSKLHTEHRYLIVFDNVDDFEVLDQIIVFPKPDGKISGDVIVTSRSTADVRLKFRRWTDPKIPIIPLVKWTTAATRKFLENRIMESFTQLIQ